MNKPFIDPLPSEENLTITLIRNPDEDTEYITVELNDYGAILTSIDEWGNPTPLSPEETLHVRKLAKEGQDETGR